MKSTLWLTTFSMFIAAPLGSANPEIDSLRSTVAEQERQIRQLEDENMKLRSARGENVTPPSALRTAVASGEGATYTVKSGDTLTKIGRNTSANPQSIAKLNGIKDPTKLKIGQKLKIPGAVAAAPSTSPAKSETAAAKPEPKAAEPKAVPGSDTYIVRNGETFYSIARKHNVSTESLVAANPGIKSGELRTGQLIRLSAKSSAAAAKSTAPKPATETASVSKPSASAAKPAAEPARKSSPKSDTAASPAAPAGNVPAPAAPAQLKTAVHSVTIDGEMTYGEFAAKHGTKIEQLNSLNGLDLNPNTVLAKGSELYVAAQP